MIEIPGKYTTAKVMINNIESECVSQITHFVNHLAFTNPVVIMPDTHSGKGAVIGFTMEISDKIVPNVVGVDVGCGVVSTNVGKDIHISLENLDHKIRSKVPFGINAHEDSAVNFKNQFPWEIANQLSRKFAMAYTNKFNTAVTPVRYDMDWFLNKCKTIGSNPRNAINSIGTLGGGNHFVELGLSQNGDHWLTIHSGSRNFGKRICDYWQNRAKKWLKKDKAAELRAEIEKIKKEESDGKTIYKKIKEKKRELNLDSGIDMKGCEWLENEMAIGYLFDMIFAQQYAQFNRKIISQIIGNILNSDPLEVIECVHNYIDFRDMIIRKGAIRSYKNEKILVPFNMRDGILICEGKSNPDWNYSAPHGCGRVMSRSKANKTLDVQEFQEQMAGIYSTSVGKSTLDEAPNAYKDAKIIETTIEPTATIIDRIKPIHNMKDAGGPPPWKKKQN